MQNKFKRSKRINRYFTFMDFPNAGFLGNPQNFMFASWLNEGDELWLKNDLSETLRSSDSTPITFVGYKIN